MKFFAPLLLSVLLVTTNANGQLRSAFYESHLDDDDYNEGSITKKNGERVDGLIQWKKKNENGFKHVIFIAVDGTDKQTYFPDDLLSFTLSFYRFISLNGKFCEVIIEGENVELYKNVSQYWAPGLAIGSTGSTTPFLTARVASTFYLKKKGEQDYYEVTDTKKKLADYFNDCPELASMIRRGDFKKGDMEQSIMDIVDLYNRCN